MVSDNVSINLFSLILIISFDLVVIKLYFLPINCCYHLTIRSNSMIVLVLLFALFFCESINLIIRWFPISGLRFWNPF